MGHYLTMKVQCLKASKVQPGPKKYIDWRALTKTACFSGRTTSRASVIEVQLQWARPLEIQLLHYSCLKQKHNRTTWKVEVQLITKGANVRVRQAWIGLLNILYGFAERH